MRFLVYTHDRNGDPVIVNLQQVVTLENDGTGMGRANMTSGPDIKLGYSVDAIRITLENAGMLFGRGGSVD